MYIFVYIFKHDGQFHTKRQTNHLNRQVLVDHFFGWFKLKLDFGWLIHLKLNKSNWENPLYQSKNNNKQLACLSCFHTRQLVYPDNFLSFRVTTANEQYYTGELLNYPYLLPELIKGLTSDKKLLINFSKNDFGKVNGGH